ncbi:helix-turn-helix transcriptional regulator [Streptomyces scopuliridis]|uniref:helix-turn-helix transcriptional regulator n=1 Tax=Streptomyces scopuliridis TaxID=452529 RepID=UPI003673A685
MRSGKGRPMKAVSENAIGKLADRLRDGRKKNSLTRAQVAGSLGCSVSTVQRAEAGHTLPSLATAHGYSRLCDLDPAEIEALWKDAHRYLVGHTRRSLTQAPHLNLVRSADELAAALVRVYEINDRPSARTMEDRAELRYTEFAPLSRSTAWRIATRQTLPSSVRILQAFLVACEVPERAFPAWVAAWARVSAREKRIAARRKAEAVTAESRKAIRVTAAEARERLRAAGFTAAEKYPGHRVPWTVLCDPCQSLSRIRLSSLDNGTRCPVCDTGK